MRIIIATALLLVGSLVHAAALTVTIWNPMPGKSMEMMQSAQAAKAIHEKLGASVTLGLENTGRLHYAANFENWQAWAKWVAKLQTSEEWAAWQAQTSKAPAAIQEENYLLRVIPGGSDVGNVYQVFIWDPTMGTSALVATAMEAKAIHEKAGINVAINIDQMQRMHYVMSFDSWDDWAKVQDTPNEEFADFLDRQSKNPTGELVTVYTATNL